MSSCSKLRRLIFTAGGSCSSFQQVRQRENTLIITDAHMEELFCCCPQLHVVALVIPTRIARRTLEAILHCRVFKALTVHKDVCISREDVAWFCEQAKQLQLLPVPTITISVDC